MIFSLDLLTTTVYELAAEIKIMQSWHGKMWISLFSLQIRCESASGRKLAINMCTWNVYIFVIFHWFYRQLRRITKIIKTYHLVLKVHNRKDVIVSPCWPWMMVSLGFYNKNRQHPHWQDVFWELCDAQTFVIATFRGIRALWYRFL